MKLPRLAPFALLLAAALLLAGCQRDTAVPWQLTSIRGHMPDLSFRLVDDSGKTVTAADYRGKVLLLYFGYTHCPDVCPLTLAHLHAVLQKLGKPADDVRILFVSVDPARDTPAVLHDYVRAFDPRAVGLTGSPRDIEALVKRYRASFTREPAKGDSGYEVSHSSAIYVFDRAGHARLLATPPDSQAQIGHDLGLLIAQKDAP
ncbi:SCO family protein [Fulvimonas sp. R45]|uniref:SCO family protein n=1 Tax=Fulvimonas sp. R45 TaxID=3045937 RepID=UPI00265DC9BF|nr:SCO family protein [Fulvimonas sp. R45]MDO1529947.1 SCO family protein [Fulvimonas sp. R45]